MPDEYGEVEVTALGLADKLRHPGIEVVLEYRCAHGGSGQELAKRLFLIE
ncbi:hypothetical protein [Micromonospora coerulea]|nr:hypothetical protein [Micromonospora veneta]